MSKKEKTVEVKKITEESTLDQLDAQLTPEQYDELNIQLDEFQTSMFSFFAGTAQFEIIPTTDERGRPLATENLDLIKRECRRLGYKVLYSIDCGRHITIVNPNTMKVVIIPNELEMH